MRDKLQKIEEMGKSKWEKLVNTLRKVIFAIEVVTLVAAAYWFVRLGIMERAIFTQPEWAGIATLFIIASLCNTLGKGKDDKKGSSEPVTFSCPHCKQETTVIIVKEK